MIPATNNSGLSLNVLGSSTADVPAAEDVTAHSPSDAFAKWLKGNAPDEPAALPTGVFNQLPGTSTQGPFGSNELSASATEWDLSEVDSSSVGGWPPLGLAALFADTAVVSDAPAQALSAHSMNPLSAKINAQAIAAGASLTGNRVSAATLSVAESPLTALSQIGTALSQGEGDQQSADPNALLARSSVNNGQSNSANANGSAAPALAVAEISVKSVTMKTEALATDLKGQPLEVHSKGPELALDRSNDTFQPLVQLTRAESVSRGLETASILDKPLAMNNPKFASEMGQRIDFMAGKGISNAQIRINPEGMGPIEISLSVDGDKVRADFTAQQSETRQQLEQQLPRLRDALNQQGLNLSQANVGDQSKSRADAQKTANDAEITGDDSAAAAAKVTGNTAVSRRIGLLDEYV